MLTQLQIRNFKQLRDVRIELGGTVVFVGPNNSGKSTALQALALWRIGLSRWLERRGDADVPKERYGVAISRRELVSVPVPNARLLWHDLRAQSKDGRVLIQIVVDGFDEGQPWACGLEFYWANEESLYCRAMMGDAEAATVGRGLVAAGKVKVSLLPPMSGLASNEVRLDPGAIDVRLGEGRTAEVLRNLCYKVWSEDKGRWAALTETVQTLFGCSLCEPGYNAARGEIELSYRTASGVELDISSSGRGLQQTLLLLSHMTVNRGSVLLLDEPDAHLEVLRQRQMYDVITETARSLNCQIITATHSEVVLNEAADRDMVIAFVGQPHRIDDRGSQVLKSLNKIGFDQYAQAEQTGWVLYLEGATDLAILRAFARVVGHRAVGSLERPFVHYVGNQPSKAREHFFGLWEARRDLVGFALFDRLEKEPPPGGGPLVQHAWTASEIENYLPLPHVLERWVEGSSRGESEMIFTESWLTFLREIVEDFRRAFATLESTEPWSRGVKVSDRFLTPLFRRYFERIGLPNYFSKTDFHELATLTRPEEVDPEVIRVLDMIADVAASARPGGQ